MISVAWFRMSFVLPTHAIWSAAFNCYVRSDKNAAVGFPTAAFAFVSDFNPCYKIAFEKQGVHPIPIWWSIAGSNR